MTDREAVMMLEGSACTPVMRRAINKGQSALQERIGREKGCEHCSSTVLPSEGSPHEFYILGNALYYYDPLFGWEGTVIEYCPWCGRPLKGEDNEAD